MVSHGDEPGRQSRRSSDTKVPSDGLSDGSTHDSDLQRSRQGKSEFKGLEAFATAKRENWCDVRDDDDSDDQDLWLSARPFGKDSHVASPVSPATPSRRRQARRRRRGVDSPREDAGKLPEASTQPPTQIPGSVVTIADIGLPLLGGMFSMLAFHQAMPAPPPVWPGIMSTSPIEPPRPPVFLPCGALGAAGGSVPVGSPTGDASTRAIYAGSPTFVGAPMTPMTPADPSLRAAPQWPDASPPPQYQCAWPWPPGGPPPAAMAPGPPMVAPVMPAPAPWPQEAQWQGMAPWQQGAEFRLH
eukprot:g10376.t1